MIGPGNQLLSDNDWTYTYDADGNLIEKVGVSTGPDKGITWTYTYDNRNQMTTAVEVKASVTLASVTYTYDVFGNRIEEDASGSTVPTQVTRFAYDGQNVWADLDGSNNLVMRRLFLNTVDSVTVRITASGTITWYLVDQLGSVNVLTDATGDVIDRITYDGYGNVITQTNPSASDRYMFTGREFDPITGLQYNRARYYDPTTGRWTTEDPLGFAAGDTNLYRYVNNQPVNYTDANGLEEKLDFEQNKGLWELVQERKRNRSATRREERKPMVITDIFGRRILLWPPSTEPGYTVLPEPPSMLSYFIKGQEWVGQRLISASGFYLQGSRSSMRRKPFLVGWRYGR